MLKDDESSRIIFYTFYLGQPISSSKNLGYDTSASSPTHIAPETPDTWKKDTWGGSLKEMPFHFSWHPNSLAALPMVAFISTLDFAKQNRTFWDPVFENRIIDQERQTKMKWPNDLTNKTRSKSLDLKTSKDCHFCNHDVHQKSSRE